ncbi:PKD domain-containing protein [Sorangium sp. So ce1078]|uniref:PKD domain-containing protein n=1 Tax=Sorangium sp. So ce1078 TaxID=3133329 RepID=UPI003F6404D8
MAQRFDARAGACGSMVIALALGASACDADKGGSTARESAANGSIQAALTVGGARHDVTGVHYKVVSASSPCSDPAIAETTSPLEEEALPGGALPPGAGTHAGADGLFVVPPGDYRVCATPMADGWPSAECGPAEGIATVISEATTELFLVSQCLGGGNGGLDTVVALNDPPAFQDLDIAPSKFITQCETATITAVAEDPDGDAISYSWELAAGAGSITGDGNKATFTPDGEGGVTVRVRATDALGGSSSLTFPIHVSAADCGTPSCEVFGTDAFGYVGCSRVEEVPSCDDISLTGAYACNLDDCLTTVALPFEFNFYGTPQTEVDIASNGKLGFPGSASFDNSCTLEPRTIAPFWDDLYPPYGAGVQYETLGTAPSRRFVVQWKVPHINGGSFYDIRAVLFEGSNDIRFCYADTTVENPSADHGVSATAGISGDSSSLVYSCQSPQLTDGLVLEFDYPGSETCSDGIQNQGETGVDCGGPCAPCTGTTVEFSEAFTQGVPSNEQCGAWDAFRASLTGEYSFVTIRGSQDPDGVTCTGAAANTLCQALHDGTPTGPIDCNGRTWVVGTGCGPSSDVVEITADGSECSCTNGYTARPCIGNENWGGAGGDTCFAPSQTISVVCGGEGGPAPTCDDGIQNQGETGVDCGGPCAPCGGATVEFSQTFEAGQVSNAQCGAWDAFRASLTGEYSSVTIRGSQDPDGVTCTGAAANTLCQALHNGTPTGPVDCDGQTWAVGTDCGPAGVVEITADFTTCVCSAGIPAYTVRPCIGNENWGGVGGDTCFAPTQTMSVVCSGEGGPAPTCDDGIQNQDETGVDCGGPCAPCDSGVCDPATEVEFGGHCYYLDGSGGACDAGYTLAPQSVLSSIASGFVGKTYKNQPSINCCIAHSDQSIELQDWGMDSADCNGPGPFQIGPMSGGAGCIDVLIEGPGQLTLCMSL